jgi:hypothetical protein
VRNLLGLIWGEWKMIEQQIVVLRHELERSADSGASRFQGLGRSRLAISSRTTLLQDKRYPQVLAIMNKLL